MSDWMEQYSAALDVRDAREQAHRHIIDAYTKLADRTASANTILTSSAPPPPSPQPQAASSPRTSTPIKPSSPAPTSSDPLSILRADLASTQKARSTLQTQLGLLQTQLVTLRQTESASSATIQILRRQKVEVETKLRDREEEIRTKAKVVADAQDEMVALQLQLNMAEQRSEKLERENRELVERWMKRMGEEVERVNKGSGWE